jgi:hypothetical protein
MAKYGERTKMIAILSVLLLLPFPMWAVSGQSAHGPDRNNEQAPQTLTNESIVKLVKEGLPEDSIINLVNTRPEHFSFAVDAIAALQKAGVSERIISAMVNRDLRGSTPSGATAQAEKREKKPLTNADVVSMVKAGLAESTIDLAIRQSPTNFDTSPETLIALKNEGLSQKILDAMLTAGTENPPSTIKPTESTAGGTASDDSGKWDVSEETPPMDGSHTVALSLSAEQVSGLVGLDGFPRLLIRCKAHQTDAFIHTGSLPLDADDWQI